MNIKKFLCFHKYKVVCAISGFYGVKELRRCARCGNEKVVVHGFPEFNQTSLTTTKHYDSNGKEIV